VLTYFEDLEIGRVRVSPELIVDGDEMLQYAQLNDPEPFHLEDEAARRIGFRGTIASGGFSISLFYRLSHGLRKATEEQLVFLGGFDWHVKFPEPVHAGDRLRLRETILEKRLSSKPSRGVVKYLFELLDRSDAVVLSIESTALVGTRP
jgi:acyl dehydratase